MYSLFVRVRILDLIMNSRLDSEVKKVYKRLPNGVSNISFSDWKSSPGGAFLDGCDVLLVLTHFTSLRPTLHNLHGWKPADSRPHGRVVYHSLQTTIRTTTRGSTTWAQAP